MPLTAAEQYMLELINRARLDPLGEAARFEIDLNQGLAAGTLDGSAKQVVAHNELLHDSAEDHSQWLLDNKKFEHVTAGGSTPASRADDAGYVRTGWVGENLSVRGTSGTLDPNVMIAPQHKSLFLSSGHRKNILNGVFEEIGIGQRTGDFTYKSGNTYDSSMITQVYAQNTQKVFLSGVVHTDTNNNDFYDIGEGSGGLAIGAQGQNTTSQSAGGYALALNAGSNIAVTLGSMSVRANLSSGSGKIDVVDGDTLRSSVDLTLVNNVTKAKLLGVGDLDLTGSNRADQLTGNAGDNHIKGAAGNDLIKGAAGNDTLDGGTGRDTLEGGSGNDKYRVQDAGDIVIEASGAGNDRVYATSDYDLRDGVAVETLSTGQASGTDAIDLAGNGLSQTIIGNYGDNMLSTGGGTGNSLRGLKGDDKYRVYHASDEVVDGVGQGNDRVYSSVDYTLTAGAEIEMLTTHSSTGTDAIDLTGNALAQTIIGNNGNNILNSAEGAADVLRGLSGDDKYRVHNAGDKIIEEAGRGDDRVYASVDYNLTKGASVETLTTASAAGSEAIDLKGNALAQTIVGNQGDNFLSTGGGAADVLRGLSGDDKYRVFNSADQVEEGTGRGNDRVYTSVDYALSDGAEIETFTTNAASRSSNIDLTGNDLEQLIVGNKGNNRIDGKGGDDALRGYVGDDTFVFSSALGADNVDRILDFGRGDDSIELARDIFSALSTGTLEASAFRANAAGTAQDADDRIIYDTTDGRLLYDADGDGGEDAVHFATLEGTPTLSHDDFDIV